MPSLFGDFSTGHEIEAVQDGGLFWAGIDSARQAANLFVASAGHWGPGHPSVYPSLIG